MKHKTLKDSIATIQSLRNAYCSQLDASALAELDDVLRQLGNLSESSDMQKNKLDELVYRILRIIDIVMRLVTNISDWMK
ncbi:hypothetical protein AAH678_28440 [Sodalis endosymbiont of Spalangia cameroni]|uniref:hypothetical protein n=1 Tax=Sodalis praecaptivus TaxID=1239307 RepID=UPI0031F7645A